MRADGATVAPPAAASAVVYTCPMHPDVVSEAPGSCPKCGMALVARPRSPGGALR